jgi:hypothetical protein
VSYALLYRLLHPLHPFLGALGFLLGEGMIAFSLVRYRLLDVDIFVSRYVVYRSCVTTKVMASEEAKIAAMSCKSMVTSP